MEWFCRESDYATLWNGFVVNRTMLLHGKSLKITTSVLLLAMIDCLDISISLSTYSDNQKTEE